MTSRREVVLAGHLADPTVARAGLTAVDPPARASALGALHRLGSLNTADLAAAAADPDFRVRRRAAELAAVYPDVDLRPFLHDIDARVLEMAAWSTGERPDPPGSILARVIELATDHADALVREAAVAALGAIGNETGLPAILRACTDKPAIRRRAIIALAPFEGPDVDAAYEKALQDRDWQVRQAAEDLKDQ